jgi:hypothetical protein
MDGVKLGCGTAVPTLLLLNRLFASSFVSGEQPPETTEIHLQDYNRAVLELVTFPNVLLAWCTKRFTHTHKIPFNKNQLLLPQTYPRSLHRTVLLRQIWTTTTTTTAADTKSARREERSR